MPVLDFFFALLPAPEYFLAVELAVEVHQPLLEAFEYTPDLLELAQVIVDPPRHLVDAGAQPHLLGRLAPFGPRLRRHQLVLAHQVAPLRMQRHQIGDDALHERQRAIGFGEGEIFPGHGVKIGGETGRRRAVARIELTGRRTCRRTPSPRSTSTRLSVFPGPLPVYFPHNDYSLNELRMRNETHHPLVLIHYDYRRANVRVLLVQLFYFEAAELRVRADDDGVGARVLERLAVGRVVSRGHTLRHDVAVGDRAEIAAVLGIVHHGHDRDVLGAHQEGHLGAGSAGGGDERLGDHDFAGEHGSNLDAADRERCAAPSKAFGQEQHP